MSKHIKERNNRSPVLKATITNLVTNKMIFTETQEKLIQSAAAPNNKKTAVQNRGYALQNSTTSPRFWLLCR